MEFINKTGHIFTLQSYNQFPFGYEFEQTPYTFWLDDEKLSTLSINNYYIRSIYALIPYLKPDGEHMDPEEMMDVQITIDSQIYNLISPIKFQKAINENVEGNVLKYFSIDSEEYFTNILTNDDLTILRVSQNEQWFYLIPFYVVGMSTEEGTWTTNVLININSKQEHLIETQWCPITIGGVWQDEHEELTINGLNFGIELPMDIFRAVYQKSFIDDEFNEQLYNEKLKEYLINYMDIKGCIGNFDSALKSLKWFGYGDKIEISKLWETDNQFKHQYLIDYFNLTNDFLESYRAFRNSTFIKLSIPVNKETGEYNEQNFNGDFWGENNPILENLFEKMVPVNVGSNEEITFWKPYYDFMFNEMGLKLSCLKYYYEKYFLPIHIQIHSATLSHRVYMNDLKFTNRAYTTIAENIINMGNEDIVEFPTEHTRYLTQQIHYVDEMFNEFESYDSENNDVYYINDTCTNIPIKFKGTDECYNCVMILEKVKDDTHEFQINFDDKFAFVPTIKIIDNNGTETTNLRYATSLDGKIFSTYMSVENMANIIKERHRSVHNIEFGDDEKIYVKINNSDTFKYEVTDEEQIKRILFSHSDEGDQYVTLIIPPKTKINQSIIHPDSADISVYIIPDMYYRVSFYTDKIKDVYVNDVNYTIHSHVNMFPTSTILYEKHFTICQQEDDPTSIYRDFVIYPKMLCDTNINKLTGEYNIKYNSSAIEYFIDGKFKLRLLCNDRWYTYEFTIKMPELQLGFGTLQYKYYNDDINVGSNFTQLSLLDEENKQVKFNSHMYEPRMVEVNHINFMEDFLKYIKLSDAKYINGDIIPDNVFCYYLDLGDYEDCVTQRLYIQRDDLGKTLYVPTEYLNSENLYLLLYKDEVFLINEETNSDNNENIFTVTELEGIISLADNDNDLNILTFIPDGNDYMLNDTKLTVYETLHNTTQGFFNKYIESHNFAANDAHMNMMHIFDLYRREKKENQSYWTLHNNIDLRCQNLRFTHKNFLDDTLKVQGYITSENGANIRPDGENNTAENNFNTRDDLTRYSVFWNDMIYRDTSVDATGYLYYEICDLRGGATGEYTTEPLSVYKIPNTDFTGNETGHIGTIRYKSLNQFKEHLREGIKNDSANQDLIPEYLSPSDVPEGQSDTFGNDYVVFDDEYIKIVGIYDARKKLLPDYEKYHFEFNEEDDKLYVTKEVTENDIVETHSSVINFKARYLVYNFETDIYEPVPLTSININDIFNDLEKDFTDDDYTNKYRLEIEYYAVTSKIVQNIEHQFTGNVTKVNTEDGFYYVGRVGTKLIKLVPYSIIIYNDKKLLGLEDKEIGASALVNQPGYHIFDVNDVTRAISEDDLINQYWFTKDEFINETEKDPNTINGGIDKNDETHYTYSMFFEKDLKWKNYLTCDLTDTIRQDIQLNGIEKRYLRADCTGTIRKVNVNNEENFDECLTDWDGFKTVIFSIDENGNINEPLMGNELGVFTGKEKNITAFMTITDWPDGYNEGDYIYAEVHPHVTNIYEEYEKFAYKPFALADSDQINLTVEGKTYTYGNNSSQEVYDLYDEFFKNIEIFNTNYIQQKIDLSTWFGYDFYLMHDADYWYGVFISKDTCDKARTIDDLLLPESDKIIYYIEDNDYISEKYKFKYQLINTTSGKEFLLNRFYYVPTGGVNHFKDDDIIIATLQNNERLPININIASKWNIKPLSINLSEETRSTSNAEMAIIDVPLNNNKYQRGYYNVDVKYSIDRYTAQQYKKRGIIRVG